MGPIRMVKVRPWEIYVLGPNECKRRAVYGKMLDSPWVGQEQDPIKMVNWNKHESIKEY